MLYFAYGSNVNADHLRKYVLARKVDPFGFSPTGAAILHDYRLRTNYASCVHGAGACNIAPAHGQVTHGVVYRISPAVREALRAKEGWPVRYEEIKVSVHTLPWRKPIEAITYAVSESHRRETDIPVTAAYRKIILDGAHAAGICPEYQQHLRRTLRITEPAGAHAIAS